MLFIHKKGLQGIQKFQLVILLILRAYKYLANRNYRFVCKVSGLSTLFRWILMAHFGFYGPKLGIFDLMDDFYWWDFIKP